MSFALTSNNKALLVLVGACVLLQVNAYAYDSEEDLKKQLHKNFHESEEVIQQADRDEKPVKSTDDELEFYFDENIKREARLDGRRALSPEDEKAFTEKRAEDLQKLLKLQDAIGNQVFFATFYSYECDKAAFTNARKIVADAIEQLKYGRLFISDFDKTVHPQLKHAAQAHKKKWDIALDAAQEDLKEMDAYYKKYCSKKTADQAEQKDIPLEENAFLKDEAARQEKPEVQDKETQKTESLKQQPVQTEPRKEKDANTFGAGKDTITIPSQSETDAIINKMVADTIKQEKRKEELDQPEDHQGFGGPAPLNERDFYGNCNPQRLNGRWDSMNDSRVFTVKITQKNKIQVTTYPDTSHHPFVYKGTLQNNQADLSFRPTKSGFRTQFPVRVQKQLINRGHAYKAHISYECDDKGQVKTITFTSRLFYVRWNSNETITSIKPTGSKVRQLRRPKTR